MSVDRCSEWWTAGRPSCLQSGIGHNMKTTFSSALIPPERWNVFSRRPAGGTRSLFGLEKSSNSPFSFLLIFQRFFRVPPPPHPALVFSGQRWPRAALFFCLWMWFVSTPQCRRRWLIPDILRGLPPRRRPLDRTFALFGRTPALRCWDFASH